MQVITNAYLKDTDALVAVSCKDITNHKEILPVMQDNLSEVIEYITERGLDVSDVTISTWVRP